MNILKKATIMPRLNLSILKQFTAPGSYSFQMNNLHSTALNCRNNCPADCTYPPQPPSGGYKAYKFLFWIAAVPAVVAMSLYNYREYEHKKKCYKRPPFVKYTYMYRRTHRFPWGDGNKSLFHNKEKNALPDGYED